MGYAEVSVNSSIAQRRTFSYSIPPHLDVRSGQAVWVPFGNNLLQGVVLELCDYPAVEETREITGIIETEPFLSSSRILLARWISEYYLSPLFDAVSLFLPPGFERNTVTFVSLASDKRENDVDSLSPEERRVLRFLHNQLDVSLGELEKKLGVRKARLAVSQLAQRGLVARDYKLEKEKVKTRYETRLSLTLPVEETLREAEELSRRGAKKQGAILQLLAGCNKPVFWSEVRENTGGSRVTVGTLEKKGLVNVEQVEIRREPISYQEITPSMPLTLSDDQQTAFRPIRSSINSKPETGTNPEVFLLHGVTGSGKTEIYLQALAEVIKKGRKGIVLVPEISLTPQTIERFAARFPHRVAVLHSRLSLREQYDEWQRIRNGEFDVVIGTRSALFAPQPDLGLIVIDEEHEWTYKQDNSPRYHTRDVAIKLAGLTGTIVILGSATPDVETLYYARKGNYYFLELPERITPVQGAPLPQVNIIDLRDELKVGNTSVFSRDLAQAIDKAVSNREQVILFLNRRGGASFVQCRICGFVLRCRRCDIALSYHHAGDNLVCHRCNYKMSVLRICPECGSRRIKFLGIGTQRLEQETARAFPGARLLRWDSDATRTRDSHQDILNRFRNHEADILIGTQMVAKGLDLPRITLVGVIIADTSLNLPDLRAGERTFQLLSQVAGRAGRGVRGGQVIIQTYSPEHYAVQAAAGHDYAAFYNKEIAYRQKLHNPPFSSLACLTYSHTNDSVCQKETERMRNVLDEQRDLLGIADISFIGPAPAFVHRLRGRFRWQLILRGTGLNEFLSAIPFSQGWTTDIDPVSLV
ncbi:primosomal protein N' [Chloroflexota bacterium]